MRQKNITSALVVIIAVLGFVVVYLIDVENTHAPVVATMQSQAGNEVSAPADLKDNAKDSSGNNNANVPAGIAYSNPIYGFQLVIPKEWEGKYKVNIIPHMGADDPDIKGVAINFDYRTNNPQWINDSKNFGSADPYYATVFTVFAAPKSEWAYLFDQCDPNSESNKGGRPHPACLDQKNANYAFSYWRIDKITDYPADFTPALFNQADGIIKTFKTN